MAEKKLSKTLILEELLLKLEAIENMAAGSEEKYKAEDAFFGSLDGWMYDLLIKYRDAKSRKNSFIDFDNCPGENEIPALVDCLRACGVRYITISSHWSSLIERMWAFCQAGCEIERMIEINGRRKDWSTGEYTKEPAFLLSIEQ